ncbi:MAG: hypothetical protein J1E06_04125 [Acutalibacter sp.]|nr:hypothetical protein [Acutalibacter sp.]
MLFRSELKKLLLTQKGLLILLVCLLLKALFLDCFPEIKDSRIALSQKQYDKYLAELQGENTPEKTAWITAEYENCKAVINNQEFMEDQYRRGELAEEEWSAYMEKLSLAYLHKNATEIFYEKADQFSEQSSELPPAHYSYEYGWQTVFTLQQFPDIFLIAGLLLLSAQCFSMEVSAGMLPVLLSARNGRGRLFRAKLFALLLTSLMAALIFGGLELAVFSLRGWLNDPHVPIYSVSAMTECTLDVSLLQGYLFSLLHRSAAALLFAALVFGCSVWGKNVSNMIFLGLCVLVVPMLWNAPFLSFTHSGLLCGSKLLLWLGNGIPLFLPLSVVLLYTAVIVIFAMRKHNKGPL